MSTQVVATAPKTAQMASAVTSTQTVMASMTLAMMATAGQSIRPRPSLISITIRPEPFCSSMLRRTAMPPAKMWPLFCGNRRKPAPVDPTDFFVNDYCNFLIKFENPSTSGFPWETPIDANDYTQLLLTTQCPFTLDDGSGSFDLNSINGQTDYYWSGSWYTAVAAFPTVVNALEETDGGHMVTVDIENLRGQYPLENREANASSSASGTIYTEHCPGLESSPFFD